MRQIWSHIPNTFGVKYLNLIIGNDSLGIKDQIKAIM
jgi:hypothetical protein